MALSKKYQYVKTNRIDCPLTLSCEQTLVWAKT